ncbi:hypothetical protein HII36_48425 [Nonomuraea sp. NN258]|uniref:hypothetical protein n=1 Tax=Nonomuraea antri TaxID=2730852 RepID=UPI0015698040|nr:hypothetical protein [Nonomuraea antri]NRQ39606.1 hypothetical protein [Nonomuraea antri]
MRIRLITVLTAALAALATVPAPSVATAGAADHSHSHGDSIRYASIKGCTQKDGNVVPCGDWRLVMHSGKITKLRDAQSGPGLDAQGNPWQHAPAPVAVSGDGQRVAYFTKAGRLAVRTLGGGVTLLPANALPRVAQADVTLKLSGDGGRLAAQISGDAPGKTRIFDTATGARLGFVPVDETFAGFSGDGDEVLTVVSGEESVTDLVVRSDGGEQLRRVTPPQVVASNGPHALAADGRTVANLVLGRKPLLITYDLETDEPPARKRIKLPAGDLHMIDWTGDTQVTLHLVRNLSRSTGVTIVQIDTGTGEVTVRDRYTLLKDTFVFAACGG